MKVAIIYGGKSTEHDISVLSSKFVINNIDKEKYEITEVYIDKDGNWIDNTNKNNISGIMEFMKQFDVVFPVLHGLYGEDGTLHVASTVTSETEISVGATSVYDTTKSNVATITVA